MNSDLETLLRTLPPESEAKLLTELAEKKHRSELDQQLYDWLTVRDFYRTDLYALSTEVLGYDYKSLGPDGEPVQQFNKRLHGPICRFVQRSEYKDCCCEMARDHFKTTIKDAWEVQFNLRHPQNGILMLMSSHPKAVNFTKTLRRIWLKNKKLRRWFPDYCPPEGMNENRFCGGGQFTLPKCEYADLPLRHEALGNYMAMGIESDWTGYHPVLAICDDIVDEDDTSPATIRNAIDQFNYLRPLIGATGHILYIGTRFADNDLLSEIKLGNMGKNWVYSFTPAVENGDVHNGRIAFPERYSREKLIEIQDIDSYKFATQYLLDPVPQETATIKEDWFYINEPFEPEIIDGMLHVDGVPLVVNIFAVTDPAYTVKTENDNVAFIIAAIDSRKHWWLLDMYLGQKRMENFMPFVSDMVEKWRGQSLGWEKNALQGKYYEEMEKYVREHGRKFRLEPLMPQEKGFQLTRKEDRIIQCIQPALSQGRVHLAKGRFGPLIQECIRLPRGRKNDAADAFGYLLGWFERPPRVEEAEEQEPYLVRHKREVIRAAMAAQEDYITGGRDDLDWELGEWY